MAATSLLLAIPAAASARGPDDGLYRGKTEDGRAVTFRVTPDGRQVRPFDVTGCTGQFNSRRLLIRRSPKSGAALRPGQRREYQARFDDDGNRPLDVSGSFSADGRTVTGLVRSWPEGSCFDYRREVFTARVVGEPGFPVAHDFSIPKQKLGSARKQGLRINVSCLVRCVVKARLLLDKRTAKRLRIRRLVGKAELRLAEIGERRLVIKFRKRAKRKLGGKRRMRFTLQIKPPYANTSFKRKLVLKR